jgi:hypothetical protein
VIVVSLLGGASLTLSFEVSLISSPLPNFDGSCGGAEGFMQEYREVRVVLTLYTSRIIRNCNIDYWHVEPVSYFSWVSWTASCGNSTFGTSP